MKWISEFIDVITKDKRIVPLTQREFLSAGFTSSDIRKLIKLNLITDKVMDLFDNDNPNKRDRVCALMPTALGRKFIKEIKEGQNERAVQSISQPDQQ